MKDLILSGAFLVVVVVTGAAVVVVGLAVVVVGLAVVVAGLAVVVVGLAVVVDVTALAVVVDAEVTGTGSGRTTNFPVLGSCSASIISLASIISAASITSAASASLTPMMISLVCFLGLWKILFGDRNRGPKKSSALRSCLTGIFWCTFSMAGFAGAVK